MMTLKEALTVPLAPLTIEQLQKVSVDGTARTLMRLMGEGRTFCYIMLTGNFDFLDDDDNRTYLETDEDGDPTDPDDIGYFRLTGYAVINLNDRTEEFGIAFDMEKLLEIAQPLHNPAKLASFVQRRKA